MTRGPSTSWFCGVGCFSGFASGLERRRFVEVRLFTAGRLVGSKLLLLLLLLLLEKRHGGECKHEVSVIRVTCNSEL